MTRAIVLLCLCLVVFLSGCAQLEGLTGQSKDKEAEEPVAQQAPAYVPQQGLSAQQRFRETLYLLEDGKPQEARAELLIYLDQQPNSDVGQDLLKQIDQPSAYYFPEDYREIRLAQGQSLSNLSDEYLGSIYKFHALAKYNGISEPRALRAGQLIRIPMTPEARAAFSAQAAGGSTGAAARGSLAEPVAAEASPTPLPAAEPDPEPALEQQLDEELAAELKADSESAPDVDEMHLEALNAYRAQDLPTAIALWDEVLVLNPGHENARLYRAQAVELQQKLRDLK